MSFITFLSLLWLIVGLGVIIESRGWLNRAFWVVVYIMNMAQWF